MLLKRTVGVGSFAVVGLALALAPAQTASAQRVAPAAANTSTPVGAPGEPVLIQRKPSPRIPTAQLQVPIDATGSIIVKFNDEVRARIQLGVINSENNVNIAQAMAVMAQFGLTAKAALPWTPGRLGRLEAKAAANSGKAQPDLAGIIEFEGPADNLLAAAKALNELPSVEWVDFRRKWAVYPGGVQKCCLPNGECANVTESDCVNVLAGFPQGAGTVCGMGPTCELGACCAPDLMGGVVCLEALSEPSCAVLGGAYQGIDSDCLDFDCPPIECGVVANDCFTTFAGPACSDQDCCTLVCSQKPDCCTLDWDIDCVGLAHLTCATPDMPPPIGPDRCLSQFNGGCFEPHAATGCFDTDCCRIVCQLSPICCDIGLGTWTGECVILADLICCTASAPFDPNVPTPLYTAAQGYLRENGYSQQANGISGDLPIAARLSFPGFTGEGWNLRGDNYALWVINEIHADPNPAMLLGDANGDGTNDPSQDEFVEIVNNFDINVSIAGWTLSVSGTVKHTFLPGTVVPAERSIVVFGGGDLSIGSFGGAIVRPASSGSLDLGNGGDTVTLTDANGTVVATNTYVGVGGTSLTRVPDVTGLEGLLPTISAPDNPNMSLFTPGTLINGDPFTDTFEGLYGLSRELFETFGIGETSPPGSTDFDDLRFNARGKGIKVAVIEWAFFEGHEDLDVISEPGLTLLVLQETEPDHATACLGIINGIEDSKGVTGIAPDAQAYFFPLTSVETGPREQAAFLAAYETLNAGDVVSCSFGPGVNLNNDLFSWTLMRLGSDIGITTCVAAGNGCDNLSQTAVNLGDSGAIVVGAGQPGAPHCRLSFSNFFDTGDLATDSDVVHVQAWGTAVTTTGKCFGRTLFNPGPAGDPNRTYCNSFGGTSAATPQIAGLVACLQGLAKQFYGIPLSPDIIRAAVATGSPQCGFIDPDDLFGFPTTVDCGPDFDEDSGPNKISNYPNPARGFTTSAGVILNQSFAGFDDSPLIDAITILTGQLIQGNVFSIKGSDDNYLIIESRFTSPTTPGQGSHGGLASGQTTDVMIEAHMDGPNINEINLIVESFVNGGSGIELIYLFDWQLNQWLAIGVDFLGTVDPDVGTVFPVENASRFIRDSDNKILIRVWTVALGISGQYRVFHDWVNIESGGGGAFLSGGP